MVVRVKPSRPASQAGRGAGSARSMKFFMMPDIFWWDTGLEKITTSFSRSFWRRRGMSSVRSRAHPPQARQDRQSSQRAM